MVSLFSHYYNFLISGLMVDSVFPFIWTASANLICHIVALLLRMFYLLNLTAPLDNSCHDSSDIFHIVGWLGRAMVLGIFQCLGVQLLWHMVGQGPAVLAAGAGWVGYVFFNLVYPIFLF